MPNFKSLTASEIMAAMPAAREILTKFFGAEGLKSASSAQLSELAKWKHIDLNAVVRDLNDMAKGTGMFT